MTLLSSRYFIWEHNILIGYFPAKDENAITSMPADSIYHSKKLKELQKTGLLAFSKRYFSNEIYKKIIDDCYIQFHRKEIFVNGKPINLFLKAIHQEAAQKIIFEVADNYFLFCKLID